MNSFQPKHYNLPVKKILKSGYKLEKDSTALVSSILYDVNSILIRECVVQSNSSSELTLNHVMSAVKRRIPLSLRSSALAAGEKALSDLESGTLKYSEKKQPQPMVFKKEMFRQGLTKLCDTFKEQVSISNSCKSIEAIILRLMQNLTEKALDSIGDKPEMCLDDLRAIVKDMLGPEMYSHAAGHADDNLKWYDKNLLDFTLKPIIKEPKKKEPPLQSSIMTYIKKKYQFPMTQEALSKVGKILFDTSHALSSATALMVGDDEDATLTERDFYDTLSEVLPETLFQRACANAQAEVMKFQCGFLKYKRPVKKEEALESADEESHVITLDFKPAIRQIIRTNRLQCTFGKDFLPYVNSIIQDICYALVKICVDSAQTKNVSVLTHEDVFTATCILLPSELRKHAFRQIEAVQKQYKILPQEIFDAFGITEDQEMLSDESEQNLTATPDTVSNRSTNEMLFSDGQIDDNDRRSILKKGEQMRKSVSFDLPQNSEPFSEMKDENSSNCNLTNENPDINGTASQFSNSDSKLASISNEENVGSALFNFKQEIESAIPLLELKTVQEKNETTNKTDNLSVSNSETPETAHAEKADNSKIQSTATVFSEKGVSHIPTKENNFLETADKDLANLLLSIPRNIYWMDVRPWELLEP